MATNVLRNLPSLKEILDSPPLKTVLEKAGATRVAHRAREILEDIGRQASHGVKTSLSELAERVAQRILEEEQAPVRPVINATGRLFTGGWGRAPLADEAVSAMTAIARGYVSLDSTPDGAARSRLTCLEPLLCELTGGEAACVVNSHASAMMLALAALAAGREVVVGRKHLIEIDSEYRLPEVIASSGAKLREVGTNRPRIEDYQPAICDQTAAVLIVETGDPADAADSAFTFSNVVPAARERGAPVWHDVGRGGLIDLSGFGFIFDHNIRSSIEQGADLVIASGDKLIGGPQCGILVGKRSLIESIVRHPLARAVRPDKFTLASLDATLRLYRSPELLRQKVPILQLIGASADNLRLRATRLSQQIAAITGVASAEPVQDEGDATDFHIHGRPLPTWCIAVKTTDMPAQRAASRLAAGSPAVVAGAADERLLFDLRTVAPRQDQSLVDAIAAAVGPKSSTAETPAVPATT